MSSHLSRLVACPLWRLPSGIAKRRLSHRLTGVLRLPSGHLTSARTWSLSLRSQHLRLAHVRFVMASTISTFRRSHLPSNMSGSGRIQSNRTGNRTSTTTLVLKGSYMNKSTDHTTINTISLSLLLWLIDLSRLLSAHTATNLAELRTPYDMRRTTCRDLQLLQGVVTSRGTSQRWI